MAVQVPTESRDSFACFGGRAGVVVMGDGDAGEAVRETRLLLEHWHDVLTRFDSDSELSLLNESPSERVTVSDLLCRFVGAAVEAARRTDGLVDPTLMDEIEDAGYETDLGEPVPIASSLRMAPPRVPARPRPDARWPEVKVDLRQRTVTRPHGLRLDSGGIAKGLLADLAGRRLSGFASYAVDCGGDLRLGGHERVARPVLVDDPFLRGVLHEFHMAAGGVATSGIGRRSWIDSTGRPAHHLLDPSTGRPAFTGVVQATALAHTALDAEIRAKAALLSGPEGARQWLSHGGVLVFDDGWHEIIEPLGVDAR